MASNVELMTYIGQPPDIPRCREISRFDFKDRVAAAARAGFQGIGIWHSVQIPWATLAPGRLNFFGISHWTAIGSIKYPGIQHNDGSV